MRESEKDEVKKELSLMGSTLPHQRDQGGFQTPDGYFDMLPHLIHDRIAETKSHQRSFTSFSITWRPVLSIAASIVLVALTISIFLVNKGKENGHFAHVDDGFYVEYLALYADLDPHFFYDMVLESNLSNEEILFGIIHDYESNDHDALLHYVNDMVDYYGLDTEILLPYDNEDFLSF